MSTNDLVREALVRWPAYQRLAEHLTTRDARSMDPRDLVGCIAAYGLDRATCLLYAHNHADSLRDARSLVDRIMADAGRGVRPRFLAELGVTAADFGVSL